MKNICFLLVALLAATQLDAQVPTNSSPRDLLQQLTALLQQSPNDEALREKIIALALTLNPKPATPTAATQAEGAAEYAFKNAKVNSDFSDAAKQYEKALLLAPWLAADYFNCGVAYERAGENKEAIRSFNLYLLATPNADDAQAVKKRIGGLQYAEAQADTPEGKAAKEYGPAQQQFAELIHKLDGAVFAKDDIDNVSHYFHEIHFYKSGRNNLMMCHLREKFDMRNLFIGQPDTHGAWEDKREDYIMPTDGRDVYAKGWWLYPPTSGGQEFFVGCNLLGRLSADGKTIDAINSYSNVQAVTAVWHRQ